MFPSAFPSGHETRVFSADQVEDQHRDDDQHDQAEAAEHEHLVRAALAGVLLVVADLPVRRLLAVLLLAETVLALLLRRVLTVLALAVRALARGELALGLGRSLTG